MTLTFMEQRLENTKKVADESYDIAVATRADISKHEAVCAQRMIYIDEKLKILPGLQRAVYMAIGMAAAVPTVWAIVFGLVKLKGD